MSIIHDALKKAQQSLSKNNGEVPAPASPGPTQPEAGQNIWAAPVQEAPKLASTEAANSPSTPNAKNRALTLRNILIIAVAVIVILLSISFAVQQSTSSDPGLKQWVKSVSSKVRRTASQAKAMLIKKDVAPAAKPLASVVLPAPVASATQSAPTLNIHGIMSRGTANVALINENVYQEGDEIQGVKIIKINMDSIVVQDNGQDKTIWIKK